MGPTHMVELSRALRTPERALTTAIIVFRYGTPMETIRRLADNLGRPLTDAEVSKHNETLAYLKGQRRLLKTASQA